MHLLGKVQAFQRDRERDEEGNEREEDGRKGGRERRREEGKEGEEERGREKEIIWLLYNGKYVILGSLQVASFFFRIFFLFCECM